MSLIGRKRSSTIVVNWREKVNCPLFLSGLDKIEFLQSHENREIYQKAFDMIERYFGTEEEDRAIAPEVDQNSEQYQFNAAQNAPMGGFQF